MQGGFSLWGLFVGGVTGGVEVCPWSRVVRGRGMGNKSVRGLSLWPYDPSPSGEGAAETEPERG